MDHVTYYVRFYLIEIKYCLQSWRFLTRADLTVETEVKSGNQPSQATIASATTSVSWHSLSALCSTD